MHIIKYGGELKKGDVIAIANINSVEFGWYIGPGKGESLQYYSMEGPGLVHEHYEKQNKLESFTLKSIRKCYIWGTRYKRIIKITNPEDIFLEDDLTDYLNSKEALTNLKFI